MILIIIQFKIPTLHIWECQIARRVDYLKNAILVCKRISFVKLKVIVIFVWNYKVTIGVNGSPFPTLIRDRDKPIPKTVCNIEPIRVVKINRSPNDFSSCVDNTGFTPWDQVNVCAALQESIKCVTVSARQYNVKFLVHKSQFLLPRFICNQCRRKTILGIWEFIQFNLLWCCSQNSATASQDDTVPLQITSKYNISAEIGAA